MGFDQIEYAGLSDVGVKRSHNQDSHATLLAGDEEQWGMRGHVFLVADGMGAHAVGELASKLAADTIPHSYSKYAQEGPAAALRKAFVEANLTIHARGQQNREFQGMGTTATALVIRPEGVWVGHVGDSRAYRVRQGAIEQLSFDHSLVWELARRHHKEPEELTGVPANVIIRSLGPEPLVQVDVEGPHAFQPGDYFLLCSDGLSGLVTDREIGAVVSTLPPAEACRFLIHLANLQGGPDNITALVIRMGGTGPSAAEINLEKTPAPPRLSPGRWRPHLHWPLGLLFLGIVLAIVAIFLTYHMLDGDLPAFILAALSLVGGLVGLMMQHLRDKERAVAVVDDNQPHVYRHFSCAVDDTILEKLAQAVATLEGRIREKQWQADEETTRGHQEQGRRLHEQGFLEEAFREHCRAMLVLMEAVDLQRKKEETFKPLWDRAPVG